jgi:hypothetical protein
MTRRGRRRLLPWIALVLLVAVGGVAVGYAAHQGNDGPRGAMVAGVDLAGPNCRTHVTACTTLARSGQVVLFGPIREGESSFPKHLISLHGADTSIRMRLSPGDYSFAFYVRPPWLTLAPNFGRDGGFRIRVGETTDLGVVQPSADWRVEGD